VVATCGAVGGGDTDQNREVAISATAVGVLFNLSVENEISRLCSVHPLVSTKGDCK